MNNAAMNMGLCMSLQDLAFSFLSVYPEVVLLDHVSSIFNFLRNCHLFHSSYIILHSYQQCISVPIYPHPLQHLLFSGVLIVAIPNRYEVISPGFDLHFPND